MKRQHVLDLCGLAGLASIVEGVREIYPPAALLVAGVSFLAFAIIASVRGTR